MAIDMSSLRAERPINTQDNMKASPGSAEELVGTAAAMLSDGGSWRLAYFDQFPAPVYALNEQGTIIYFNPACVEFAGRTPALGVDQWCVTWKLSLVDGTDVSHDECTMAVVVREGRKMRGVQAVATRPDGSRRRFHAFPTPAFNDNGDVIGGVNLLVPADGTTERKLLATATKCRNLARWVSDDRASDTLKHMAAECEGQAAALRID